MQGHAIKSPPGSARQCLAALRSSSPYSMQAAGRALEGSLPADGCKRVAEHPDGRVERWFTDGRRSVKFANGTEKLTLQDGTTVVLFGNGDIKRSWPQGGVQYFYKEVDTWHTTLASGVEVRAAAMHAVRHGGVHACCEAWRSALVRAVLQTPHSAWRAYHSEACTPACSGSRALLSCTCQACRSYASLACIARVQLSEVYRSNATA